MRPSTNQHEMSVYGANASYISEPTNIDAGHIPLDTLPAAWWNWLFNQLTLNNNGSYTAIADLRSEMLAVLTEAGITPSEAQTNQLLQAVEIIRKKIATTSTPGAIKSSSDIKSISVGADGTPLVNALSDWSGTDTVADKLSDVDAKIEQEISDRTSADSALSTTVSGHTTAITNLQNGKKNTQTAVSNPTASGTATAFVDTISQNTQGVITATRKNLPTASTTVAGIVQLNNTPTNTSTTQAATINAVKLLRDSLGSLKIIAATSNSSTTAVTSNGTYINLTYTPTGGSASVLASIPTSYLGIAYATAATYLRPSNSTSALVTADTNGNLRAHTLQLT